MAVTAESVVVELVAKVDGYEAKINGAASTTDTAMSKIEQSASRAEQSVSQSSARIANAQRNLGRQFSDIGAQLSTGGLAALPTIFAQQIGQIVDALTDLNAASSEVKSASNAVGSASLKTSTSLAGLTSTTSSARTATVQLAAADVAAVPATAALASAARVETVAVAGITPAAASAAAATTALGAASTATAAAVSAKAAIVARAAAFFAGPWGAALLAAGSVLAVFISKAIDAGDSVEGLIAKLEENAEKTKLTAEAQRVFEGTAIGAAAAVDKMNEALGKANLTQEQALRLDLARARSLRQVAVQVLKVAEAEARKSALVAEIAAAENAPGFAGSAEEAMARERGASDAANRQAAAQRALGAATRARVEAEKAVANAAIPLLDNQAAAATDKNAAATRRHEIALGRLRNAYIAASAAATTNAEREAATRNYRVGRENIDRRLAADTQREKAAPKGESAETRARRAEAARIRDVRNDEAFTSELEQLNQQIIAAQRERANTAAEAAQFERQAIDSEYRKRREAIAADLSAKKYSAAQAAELNERNEYAKALRLRNVAINEDVRHLQELAAQDATTVGIQQEDAQARLSIADARDERKAIELELIKLKYQERREQLEYLRAQAQIRGDVQAQADATQRLEALPDLRRAEETGVDQRYRGRYENYRRSLDDADALRDSIEGVQIQTLEAITDELTNATTAALGLKGAFGQIVGELIRIGIQRRLIGPLADTLFGKADGSSGGSLSSIFSSLAGGGGSGATFGGGNQGQAGGILSAIGSSFGRASGGYVGPGQTVRVNENRGPGVELLRMGSRGGTVIPLGQANATARRSAGMTVLQTIQVDARGSVMADSFASQILARADQGARQIVSANNGAIRKSLPAAQQRFSDLGTTG